MDMCKWTNNTLVHHSGMPIPPMLDKMIIIAIEETPHNTKIFTRIVIVVTLCQAVTTKRLMGNHLYHLYHLPHKASYNSSNLCKTNRISNINSNNCWRQTRQSTRLRCARTGLRLASADTATSASSLMETRNLLRNLNQLTLSINPRLALPSKKSYSALMAKDAFSDMKTAPWRRWEPTPITIQLNFSQKDCSTYSKIVVIVLWLMTNQRNKAN